MNMLESPLEALALNYLSVGFLTVVNNLWTWVAVITAAFSFWRIRAAGGATATSACPKSGDSPPPHRNDRSSNRSEPVPQISVPDVSTEGPRAPVPAPAPGMVVGDVEFDGVTKGTTFVAVYQENDRGEGDGELTVAENEWEESGGDDGVDCCDRGEWWERVLRMRTGEMEWYRYQDLTVLNGNVVRLWEGTSCIRI